MSYVYAYICSCKQIKQTCLTSYSDEETYQMSYSSCWCSHILRNILTGWIRRVLLKSNYQQQGKRLGLTDVIGKSLYVWCVYRSVRGLRNAGGHSWVVYVWWIVLYCTMLTSRLIEHCGYPLYACLCVFTCVFVRVCVFCMYICNVSACTYACLLSLCLCGWWLGVSTNSRSYYHNMGNFQGYPS